MISGAARPDDLIVDSERQTAELSPFETKLLAA